MQLEAKKLAEVVGRAEEFAKRFPGREEPVFIAIVVAGLLGSRSGTPGEGHGVALGAERPVSMGELFVEKDPRSEPEKGVVAAFYLERERGLSAFNVDDLEQAFVSGKEKIPGNLNDVINKAITKGWVMEVPGGKDGKKAWCLTRSGVQTIEKGFSRDRKG